MNKHVKIGLAIVGGLTLLVGAAFGIAKGLKKNPDEDNECTYNEGECLDEATEENEVDVNSDEE